MFKKIGLTIGVILLLVIIIVGYFRFYWVYAEGTKAGVLNVIQRKGVVFKTWEGRLIQSGFRANVESIAFEFSIEDEAIAKKLEQNSGNEVNLHYRRYMGALPWRGQQGYIVDSIYEIRATTSGSNRQQGIEPTISR